MKDIDAHSTTQDLAEVALANLIPRIQAFCPDFSWRDSEFVVRDKEWVNLLTYTNRKAYFYDNCLREGTGKKSKTMTFVSGKQFTLFVVVPERQWAEFAEFRDRLTNGPAPSVSESAATALAAPVARKTRNSHRSGVRTIILSESAQSTTTLSVSSPMAEFTTTEVRLNSHLVAVIMTYMWLSGCEFTLCFHGDEAFPSDEFGSYQQHCILTCYLQATTPPPR